MLIVGHNCVPFLLTSRHLVLGRVLPKGQDSVLGLQPWDMSTPRSSGQLTPLPWFSLFPPLANTPLSKQTLPLKVFLVTVTAIFGLTLSADNALLKFEARQRIVEAAVRKEARIELAKRGLVPTETEIAKWREVNGK